MERIFENVQELTTRVDYETVLSRVKELIREATERGNRDVPVFLKHITSAR